LLPETLSSTRFVCTFSEPSDAEARAARRDCLWRPRLARFEGVIGGMK
jgi:hypothetical protein